MMFIKPKYDDGMKKLIRNEMFRNISLVIHMI